MTVLLGALLLAAPAFETFDAPLDPRRWYVGAPNEPRKGSLALPKGGWIATRDVPEDGLVRLEVRFRHTGGDLEVTFHDRREPLAAPKGAPLVVPRRKGERVLVVTGDGAKIDGEALDWKGAPSYALRLGGRVELDEIRMLPAPPAPVEPSALESRTLFHVTTPPRHGEYRRVTLTLWDVPVSFLLRRGPSAIEPLQGPGGPLLGWLVTVSDGKETARRAMAHDGAMRDWSDERANLGDEAFRAYVAGEYARFELLAAAQRVMNASLPGRKLEPLVPLAVVRHANAARSAAALAEMNGDKAALKLLRAGMPRGRASSDAIRAAAAAAARKLLGRAPEEWRGFAFDPTQRYATLQEAKEHLR